MQNNLKKFYNDVYLKGNKDKHFAKYRRLSLPTINQNRKAFNSILLGIHASNAS